jgi:hypothetical protein
MKLKYVDYYEKGVSRLVNGVPVVVDGKVVRDVKPMFLYAVVDATPEEISMYKRFKRDNPDGKDYYRESENGIPLWHNPEFVGMVADISSYKDKEGKIRFRVNKAVQGALEGMRKMFPSLSSKIDDQLWALLATGTAVDLNTLGSSVASTTDVQDDIVETDDTAPEGEEPETPSADDDGTTY